MKKYMTPEMEMMDFIIDESIAGIFGSALKDPTIEGEFGGW